jgi:hypothetical protein
MGPTCRRRRRGAAPSECRPRWHWQPAGGPGPRFKLKRIFKLLRSQRPALQICPLPHGRPGLPSHKGRKCESLWHKANDLCSRSDSELCGAGRCRGSAGTLAVIVVPEQLLSRYHSSVGSGVVSSLAYRPSTVNGGVRLPTNTEIPEHMFRDAYRYSRNAYRYSRNAYPYSRNTYPYSLMHTPIPENIHASVQLVYGTHRPLAHCMG